jgi:hypothetical protein
MYHDSARRKQFRQINQMREKRLKTVAHYPVIGGWLSEYGMGGTLRPFGHSSILNHVRLATPPKSVYIGRIMSMLTLPKKKSLNVSGESA